MFRARAAFLVTFMLVATGCLGRGTGVRSPALASGPCGAAGQEASSAEWSKLREAFPYHLQTIAISPVLVGGCRTLIVAEPPPGVGLKNLKQIAPELLESSELRRHTIGYDGWTQDVVFTIPPTSESALRELVADLHGALFGTTYRLQAIDTNTRPPAVDPMATPLDITVGPGDLNRWLLAGQGSSFRPVRGGPAVPFRQLLETSETGLYIDAEHGLVSWIIPRSADIAAMRALFRQFAMESDLIVGAIASERRVAVIARQRIVDPLVLQPLRFETMALLAAVDTDELGQSYERNHFLAGKLADFRDWAPIYLSPELIDTEYGSVLNIADQFLKSWSNHGTTRYINFAYPPPARWPFSAPIFKLANTKKSLTYNWNTTSAGASIEIGGLDVFWLRRTGALNVSYIADQDPSSMTPGSNAGLEDLEERGHQFFARTQNPFLVRVVQYNSLYQIFKRFHIVSSWRMSGGANRDATGALVMATRSLLLALRSGSEGARSKHIDKLLSSEAKQLRAAVQRVISILSQELRHLSPSDFERLVAKLATPRRVSGPAQLFVERDSLYEDLIAVHNLLGAASAINVHESYARSLQPERWTWIHTPSIVVSWNEKPLQEVVGGHNLSAEVDSLMFDPSTTVKPSQANDVVHIVGPTELEYLTLGRQGPTLALTPQVHAPRVALGIRAEPPPPRSGWRIADGSGTARAEHDVLIVKNPDSYTVVDSTRGIRYETTTRAEAVELAGGVPGTRNGKLVIETRNFTPDEGRGLARAMELRTTAKLAGVIESPPKLAQETVELSSATVGNVESRALANGASSVGMTIEVPTGTRTLRMRVQAVFKKITPERLQSSASKIEESAHSFIDGHSSTPAKIEDLGLDLREVIKEVAPDCELIEVKLQAELSDFTIGEIELQRDARGTGRHAS